MMNQNSKPKWFPEWNILGLITVSEQDLTDYQSFLDTLYPLIFIREIPEYYSSLSDAIRWALRTDPDAIIFDANLVKKSDIELIEQVILLGAWRLISIWDSSLLINVKHCELS